MIAIRTKNLSPLFSDILGLRKFLNSFEEIGLVISPSDGNDWELSGAIPEKVKAYSLIPYFNGHEEIIKSHKLALGKFDIIPLFPASSNYPEELRKYSVKGIYDVKWVSEISKFKEDLERFPEVIRISVNPLDYPKEILDYCKKNNIKVIGTEIFGSDIFKEYYKRIFPESFLQSFGEYNSDILEIPGDDPYFIKRIYSRLGKGQENKKLLEYTKTIKKLPSLKIPDQKIYQYSTLEVEDLGKITIPGMIGKFSLKPIEEKTDFPDPIWVDDLIPEDVDKTNKKLLGTLHRYHVLPQLSNLHSPKIWKPVFTKIDDDFWTIKMIPRKWLGWFWKETLYWYISGKLWKMPLSKHKNLIID